MLLRIIEDPSLTDTPVVLSGLLPPLPAGGRAVLWNNPSSGCLVRMQRAVPDGRLAAKSQGARAISGAARCARHRHRRAGR